MNNKDEYLKRISGFKSLGIDCEVIKDYDNGNISLIKFTDNNKRSNKIDYRLVLHLNNESISFVCNEDVGDLIK